MGDPQTGYTTLAVTPLLEEAVKHIISRECDDVELERDLKKWSSEEHKTINFAMVKRVHSQLCLLPLPGSKTTYLHDLLSGTVFCFPQYVPPARNPELVTRLEKIKATAQEKEYQQMVKNVDRSSSRATVTNFGLEVSSVSRQLWAMVNFLLTVVGSFIFGYFAAYFANMDATVCVLIGLGFGVIVFLADLYFLVRSPQLAIEGKTLKTL